MKENIFRDVGAHGISINKEFVKNAIRLHASRFIGTSIADSFIVKKQVKSFYLLNPWVYC